MLKKLIPLLLLLLWTAQMNAQVKKYEVKDFFRNAEKTRFQISPDGDLISYLAPWNNRMNIFVQKTGSKEAKRVTNVTDRDISDYFWKTNSSLVYSRDFGGDENYHVYVASVDGKSEKDLTPFSKVRASIVDQLEDFPDHMLVEMNKDNPEVFDVYKINIRTGKMTQEAKNPGNISTWITDHNGNIRAAVATDGVESTLLVRNDPGAAFKELIKTDFRQTVSPLFFTFDNKNLYVASNLQRDLTVICEISTENGNVLNVLYKNEEVDVSDLFYSKKDKKLLGCGYEGDKYEYHFFDPAYEKMYNRVAADLKGYRVAFVSNNRNEDIFLVRTYSDRSLGAYYLYDLKTDQLKKLHEVSPWINEDDMAIMEPIRYEAADGIEIKGYLTLPPGVKEAKNLPVVINPHGGPWARDSWGWNPEVQFLASRGYAVLQMNFRGSTGYGRKFWELSFKQWGLSMQSDITAGAEWLIKQGIADPKRIAIYGASYGGYATLAGITFTPDLYACAIDYVGVSNLFTFMQTIPPYWKPYLEMMYEMVGNPNNPSDSVMMRDASPVFHVEKIKTPLFIAQGAKDPRVNKNESDQMVKALLKNGVDVQYLVKENEGHGFRNEENKFEFYSAMEQFLAQHLLVNTEQLLRAQPPTR